ncbi:MAG: DUF2383 domain-containing protein [Myxococcota bacterium]
MPTPTLAGTQKEAHRLLEELIKLDYDAIEAYQAAIERLSDEEAQRQLGEFRDDHRRHTENLGAHLREMHRTPPSGPDVKRVLTKGKVVIASLRGDVAILKAMKSNEDDTNTVYERAVEQETPAKLRDTIRNNLDDERRHRAWIEDKLGRMG